MKSVRIGYKWRHEAEIPSVLFRTGLLQQQQKKKVRNLFKSQAQALDTRHVVMAGYTCLQAAI